MVRAKPRPNPSSGQRSSFILSLAHHDVDRGWRVTLIDLRTGERFEFDSLEATWFFLGQHKPRSGLR
jgi:hypothetical protein